MNKSIERKEMFAKYNELNEQIIDFNTKIDNLKKMQNDVKNDILKHYLIDEIGFNIEEDMIVLNINNGDIHKITQISIEENDIMIHLVETIDDVDFYETVAASEFNSRFITREYKEYLKLKEKLKIKG